MTKEEQEKHILILGHMFSNSYHINNKNIGDLEKAKIYYKNVLEREPNFFVKLHILGFFSELIVSEYFRTEKYLDNKGVTEYKEILEKFLQAEDLSNKNYINSLKDFKASILIYLNMKDEYMEFYEKNEDILFKWHYLQYCNYKKIKINHELVQKELINGEYLLLMYANLLVLDKEERINILSYFNKNIDLLLSIDWVVYFYVLSSIEEEYKINNEVKDYISKNFGKNFELIFSYLILKDYEKREIEQNELDDLFVFLKKGNIDYREIIEVVKFLFKRRQSKLYIDLAILKQDEFPNIVGFVLDKCYKDSELRIDEFEYFIDKIGNLKPYYSQIGSIYFNFHKLDKSFKYYYKIWDDKKEDIVFAKNALITCLHNFERYTNRIDEEKEDEILYYFQSIQKELSFQDISLLVYYNLVVRKDLNSAFNIINKKILSLNIYIFDNQNKKELSTIYFNSLINCKDKELDSIEKNNIYHKNHKYYLDEGLYKEINEVYLKIFDIELVDKIKINQIKDDNTYSKKSLFHLLINPLLKTIENPNFLIMEFKVDNYIEDLQQLLTGINTDTQDLLEKYSNGSDIGFWSLCNGYDKYFNLIVKLIENKNLNFNSCRLNFQEKNINKLLTLSSIIFLNYLGKLDEVLKREDVYIQKTTFDYLNNYINKLGKEKELFYISLQDEQLYKNIITKEEIEKFIINLKYIINNFAYSRVVDDTKSILLYKDTYPITESIGIQEYHALAFCYENKFQLITEDRILEVISGILRFQPDMISNSLSLLEKKEVLELSYSLHIKKYKYVLYPFVLKYLVYLISNKNIVEKFREEDIEIVKIMNNYGWLEDLKLYYKNTYKVLYPKINIVSNDYIADNIEYIIKIVDK